ncbi:MAG: NmrA/HSCARG family protein [Gammaproteobacteria bacterium]|nr:NmrA/HSCARG family protein [Gammaproteobacteria bacterium]NND48140.1 NmrA/HSCARG family protein [Woeseiaceae bacterium]NNL45675.1 NmrA/HSCARG family protein [Woeseiaceae bacterium]
MASNKKIIVVVGATGAQGGGLLRAILDDPQQQFQARALTRNANSDKAQMLAARGAEVAQADLDDLESLQEAFKGAYGAFCVTNFWEHFSPQKELAQAKNLAEAARHAGLEHVVWSTLEDTRQWVPLGDDRMPTLMDNYKVPHFDAKGEANQEFSDRGVPTTFLLTSFYWDNLISFGMEPKRDAEGTLEFVMPMADKPLSGIASADIGRCSLGIFKRGAEFVGKTLGIAGQHLTGGQMAAAMSKAFGETVRYSPIEPGEYRALGFPGAEDLGNMYQFKRDFNDYFCGARSIEVSRSLNPGLMTFDDWLAKNKDRIPVEKSDT